MYDIRHHTVAHKEKDALRQADLIKNIDTVEVHDIGQTVFKVLQALIVKFVELLREEKD